jgi:hypothetical protein
MSATNNSGNSGFLGLGKLFGKATNAVKNVMPGTKNAAANNAVKPVTAGPVNGSMNQTGGMAPVNYRAAHMQPSEGVMKWATTAGADMPSKTEMRGVAHGGRRRSKTRGHRKSKRATGGRHHKTHRRRHHKRKTHRRRHN